MQLPQVFRILMVAVYIAAGSALLLTEVLADRIKVQRHTIGWVLVGYGVVRGVLWYRSFRSDKPATP